MNSIKGEAIRGAPLSGRWTALTHIQSSDHEFLYRLAIENPDTFRWRFPVAIPSFEIFRQHIPQGIHSQFMVYRIRDNSPIGTVVAHHANIQNGIVTVRAAVQRSLHGAGLGVEGCLMFVNYLFTNWNFRKVYFPIPEYSIPQIGSLIDEGILKREGNMHEYIYCDGKLWDETIFAVYRNAFMPWMAARVNRGRKTYG